MGFREIASGTPEWCEFILRNARDIYVRAEVDGRWQTVSLAELSDEQRDVWLARWTAEGRTMRVEDEALEMTVLESGPSKPLPERDEYGSYAGHRWGQKGPCGCENCVTRKSYEEDPSP